MTIKTSQNHLTFSEIESEFGKNPSRSLGDYRRSISKGGVNWPLDDGIPTSGTISFSDFLGKQHNIIIVLSGGGTSYRQKILNDKTSITSTGFRGTGKSVRKTSKNIVYITRTIGSEKAGGAGGRPKCALRTQTNNDWFGGNPSGARVLIRLGSGGKLYGAGGDGGKGAKWSQTGSGGEDGTSALGLQINVESVTVDSGGIIQAGGGGGGGGGSAAEYSRHRRKTGGGGGGGGAGLPAGTGGAGGSTTKKYRNFLGQKVNLPGSVRDGDDGNNGSLNNGGNGGDGGNSDGEARGGGAGGGGATNGNQGEGGEGKGSNFNGKPTDGADGVSSGGEKGKGGDGGHGWKSEGGGGGAQSGGNAGFRGLAITRNPGLNNPTRIGESRIHGGIADKGVL